MRVKGVEYDTWNWRFRVGERIRHDGVTYDIISRDAASDSQGLPYYVYTLRTPDGSVARVVRNYIVNLEARRAGAGNGKSEQCSRRASASVQQLRDGPDGGVQASSDADPARKTDRRATSL